jgi:hypothetical protein
MLKIAPTAFYGGACLTDGSLADGLRQLAIFQAKTKANGVATLTDNSGGAAADGVLGAIPLATATPLTGDTCPTKTEAEAALVTAVDAVTELAAKVVTVAAVVPAFVPTNSVGGAAADGTIGAITTTSTGAAGGGGTCVAKAGYNTAVAALSYVLAEIARDTNALCTACGVALLTGIETIATLTTTDNTYSAVSTGTGTAAANGTLSISQANHTATMTAIAAAVKEIATKLNLLRDGTTPAVGAIAV